ncbi:MAG: hypothetical protein IK096_00825 [Lachnospiraceae bacterium]|nr:hypothetical protein [Lachnospiraceae bacterium]
MRHYQMDAFVDENLSKLNGMLDQFPEGTYQRAMVDYMIQGLEAVRDRDLCIDIQNNPLSNEMPGVSIADKVANYGFIPTIATKSINPETGKEELVLPEDLPEDDGFMQPRGDQLKRKTYSQEELQQSADRINFSGFNNAGFAYSRALRDNINLVSMGGPSSPEEEQILAEHILESMNAAEREMRKAMDVDPKDPVAQRAFDGQEGTLQDAIFSNGRGFAGNIRAFENYRRYIESGLPVTGFSEYNEMRTTADDLVSNVGAHSEVIENVDAFYNACKEYQERINDLPPRGASAEEREAWRKGVEESMLRVSEEKKKLEGNLKLKDRSFPEVTEQDPQKRAAAEKERSRQIERWENQKKNVQEQYNKGDSGLSEKVNRVRDEQLSDIKELGRNTIKKRQRYLDGMMKGISDEMRDMSREVTDLAKKNKISPELQAAVDKLARVGDSDRGHTPREFGQALNQLKQAAEKEKTGNREISEWALSNAAHFKNRMTEAQKKGVSMDESLNLQRQVNARNGKDKVAESLEMFNTKRASFFKNETKEHENARKAAEAFQKAKNELAAMNKDYGNPDYVKKANEVSELAGKMSGAALDYLKDKEFAANTPTGQQRISGAASLFKEGKIVQATIRKEMEAHQRYQAMQAENQRLRERNAQIAAQDKLEAEQRMARTQGIIRDRTGRASADQRLNVDAPRRTSGPEQVRDFDAAVNRMTMQNSIPKPPKDAPRPVPPAPPKQGPRPVPKAGQVNDISFDALQQKLMGGQPKKPQFQGRKAPEPQMNGPVKGAAVNTGP